ncbi:MAG: hypothetical protein PHD06_04355 [Bacteroidales bacterium]|jgi:hypothetical protein|nr:hypothetical protein [Bacteroidales bacterium]MDY0197761.1 hypothetical protein [Tenuifilaceae bacterium]
MKKIVLILIIIVTGVIIGTGFNSYSACGDLASAECYTTDSGNKACLSLFNDSQNCKDGAVKKEVLQEFSF